MSQLGQAECFGCEHMAQTQCQHSSSSHNSCWHLVGHQVPVLDGVPAWKGEVFVGKGHGWDIAWLCFLLKHVTIWFLCLEVVNSCSEQRRMVLLHRGWVSFYEPWKVVLFTGKGLSTHICQFILEHINPSKHQEGNKVAWCGYDLDHDMNISKCSLGRKKI